ncbi:phage-associated protein [Megasphaera sp. BL7]|jgi:hypothetical protein|uniref:DUF2815 family protein n=1 Tax=unclassified Megasphaera TaxID=2626256 RepID=UPI0003570C43|nr:MULTISPECIES: DUF2815 family protein [unclassified Megasphaera]EPP17675.1 phage-associated protein [Megasphaera sp. BL7]EPP18545.1 phage-associated protein [Megasphaera sp. NM10]DAE75895.1 MAG TPA: DNA helix destabilizing protein [Caudoviricetes sp.]
MANTIQTGLCRLSYAYVFSPRPNDDPTQKPKYTASIIIPKSEKRTIAAIKEKIAQMRKDPKNISTWGGSDRGIHEPLRDADTDELKCEDPNYKGCYFMNASSTKKPKLFSKDRSEIIDPDDLYSGCWCQFMLNLFAYSHSGKKGIGVGLTAIRKIKDGEPLGGVVVSADSWDDNMLDEADLQDADQFF